MTVSLTILIVSALGIIFLVLLKSYELSTNRGTFLARISSVTDRPILSLASKINRAIGQISLKGAAKTAGLFFAHLIHDILGLLKLILDKVQRRFSIIINMIKGKESLGRRGASSVYLKSIGEYKKGLNGNNSDKRDM